MNIRLVSELPELSNKYPIKIYMHLETFRLHVLDITLHIQSSYPFTPPSITIEDLDWCSFCSIKECSGTLVKKYSGHNCLCCNSKLQNWSPIMSINTVIDEVDNIKRIKNKIFCEYVLIIVFPIEIINKINDYF